MRLTPNFEAWEFDVSGPWPAAKATERMQLAHLLEWFRARCGAGRKAIISNAYRTPERNARTTGAAKKSEHMDARAVDVVFMVSDRDFIDALLTAEAKGEAPDYGQVIVYDDTLHTHISLARTDGRPNRQKLRAGPLQPDGSRTYTPIRSALDVPLVRQATAVAGAALVVVAVLALSLLSAKGGA